jgi:hypothetical protein
MAHGTIFASTTPLSAAFGSRADQNDTPRVNTAYDVFTVTRKLCNADWSVSTKDLPSFNPTNEEVGVFIAMLKKRHGKLSQSLRDYPSPDDLSNKGVDDFLFVDMDGDSVAELIAAIPDKNSPGKYSLIVVKRTKDNFVFQTEEIPASSIDSGSPLHFTLADKPALGSDDIDGTITDLAGDGKKELIIFQLLTSDRKGQPQVRWPAVYAYDSQGDFVNSSDSKKVAGFYNAVLAKYNDTIDQLQQDPANAEAVLLITLARDKILRVTGRVPYAGYPLAQSMANDPRESRRILAIAVFADIGLNPVDRDKVILPLRKLAFDYDFQVRQEARLALRTVAPFSPFVFFMP